MRTAFNDMLNRQKITEYEAGFLAMVFAATFVEQRVGRQSRDQLIENVVEQLDMNSREDALPTLAGDHHIFSQPVTEGDSADEDASSKAEIAKHIRQLLANMKLGGIPDADIPPVLVDYTGLMALALAGEMGLQTLIMRMQDMLDDYSEKRPPFDAQE